MAFNWKESADTAGNAEKIPEGIHRVQISRVITEKKDGEEMTFKKTGDRFIMVIFSDKQAREASSSFALGTQQGGGMFSRMILAAGVNTEALDKAGATPETFFDSKWASKLVGKQLEIECKRNGDYLNVYPIMPQADRVDAAEPEPAEEFDPEADLTDDDRAALAANAAATDDILI